MNIPITHESSFQNRAASTIPSLALLLSILAVSAAAVLLASPACAQIGTRFPSEKKIVIDPVTGVPLTFLTTKPGGDAKIYQTHHQWTSDGKWLVFRSNRIPGQAMAVNEETGDLVQVTEGGFTGMLCLADHKRTAADHPHPTFSADSTRIQIQSAMISEDGRSMNICVIPVPEKLLQRTYATRD
ncbi:MAG: PD40 domain-containing protein [Verrucomicrobia bacterium]|nr:PD40 domain-containing protein [Verrucomicrobiota bacterium]